MFFFIGAVISAVSCPRVHECGNFGGFEMRINAVILEALQRPIAGLIHLRRAGKPSSNPGGQILEIFHQFGVGLHFLRDLLIGLFHRGAISALLIVAARLCEFADAAGDGAVCAIDRSQDE